MKPSRCEQKTTIPFNKEEPTASVYTHNKKLIEKLERMAPKLPIKSSWNGWAICCCAFQGSQALRVREPYSAERRTTTTFIHRRCFDYLGGLPKVGCCPLFSMDMM